MPLSDYNAVESTMLNEISQANSNQSGESQPTSGQTPSIDFNMPIKYRASGRDLEEPLSAVIQRAQRGYDYAQLVEKHKQRESDLTSKEAQINDFAKKWQPYIDYANHNPQWADHVRTSWESVMNQSGQPLQTAPATGEISEIKAFIEDMKREREMARQAQEDAALAAQIDGVRKEYADFDWQTTDPASGESLEYRVMKHGQTHSIANFRAAFRDMMHDQLIEREKLKAKEAVAQNIQNRSRQGFLAESSTPVFGSAQSSGKPRNYEEAILRGLQN